METIAAVFAAAPFWLSLLFGAAIAIIGWSRSPKAAMAILAAIVLIVVTIFGEWMISYLISYFFRDSRLHGTLHWIVYFMGSTIRAAAFVFICLAAFIDRRPANPLDRPL